MDAAAAPSRAPPRAPPATELEARLWRRLLPRAKAASSPERNQRPETRSRPSAHRDARRPAAFRPPQVTPEIARRYRQEVGRSRRERLTASRGARERQRAAGGDQFPQQEEDSGAAAARRISAQIEGLVRGLAAEAQAVPESGSQGTQSQGGAAERERAAEVLRQLGHQFRQLLALPHRSVKQARLSLSWDLLPEGCLLDLVDEATKSGSIPPRNFEWLLEEAVIPLIRNLVHPPSRELTSQILCAIQRGSPRVQNRFLILLFTDRQLGLHQAELAIKIIKQDPPPVELGIAFRECFPPSPGLARSAEAWSDAFVGVIKTLVEACKLSPDSDSCAAAREAVTLSVDAFLRELECQVQTRPDANGLASLLQLFIQKNSEVLKRSPAALEAAGRVAAQSTSFLQRGIKRALSRLQG